MTTKRPTSTDPKTETHLVLRGGQVQRPQLPATFGPRPVIQRQTRFQAHIQPRIPGLSQDRGDIITGLFAIFALFVFSGSLVELLTPAGATSSAKVQALGLLIGAFSFGALALRGAIPAIVTTYWTTLLPVAFAGMSILWSVSGGLSLRRLVGLCVATAFALWLADRFRRIGVFQFIAGAAFLIVVLNVAVAIAVPSMGVHPSLTELGEPNPHSGAWRGLFFHKNDFGRMMALCAMILWIGLTARRQWRLICGIGVATAYLGVAGSTSGQAAVLSVVGPAAVYALGRLRPLTPAARATVLVLAGPVLAVAYVFSSIAFTLILQALGKDPTLTGRTEIWGGVLQALDGHYLLGGGFGAGWDIVGERLFILTGILVGHAHNGYLDLMTDLGIVGLVLMVTFYVGLIIMATRAFFTGQSHEVALLAFGVGVFAIVGNWAASFLLLHNSLYWVLPVVCAATLRRPSAQNASQADWAGWQHYAARRAGMFTAGVPVGKDA